MPGCGKFAYDLGHIFLSDGAQRGHELFRDLTYYLMLMLRLFDYVQAHNACANPIYNEISIPTCSEEERKVSYISEKKLSVTQLCVRINNLYKICNELDVVEEKVLTDLRNNESTYHDDLTSNLVKKFELKRMACIEGFQQISELLAHKVVFHDLSHGM
ncbi:unnamed protein product [Arabis nemorensis]|uniref:PATROL1-like C-terminal domain-containing protein n=1 Tax=Arabis nemorensis TaxID=586526 RepID=A0A565ATE5_9BRAS|nr:unnamed protein product [Arabis nemorensis]